MKASSALRKRLLVLAFIAAIVSFAIPQVRACFIPGFVFLFDGELPGGG